MSFRGPGSGYAVVSAGSGGEALAALGARGSEVDLLLTDIALGDLHGGELAVRRRGAAGPAAWRCGPADGLERAANR